MHRFWQQDSGSSLLSFSALSCVSHACLPSLSGYWTSNPGSGRMTSWMVYWERVSAVTTSGETLELVLPPTTNQTLFISNIETALWNNLQKGFQWIKWIVYVHVIYLQSSLNNHFTIITKCFENYNLKYIKYLYWILITQIDFNTI